MADSYSEADALELQSRIERAASAGITTPTTEDELVEGTAFGDSVRQSIPR